MVDERNTNSPIAAAAAVIGLVLAFLWQSWSGTGVYVLGFGIGAVGTARNAVRWMRARRRLS